VHAAPERRSPVGETPGRQDARDAGGAGDGVPPRSPDQLQRVRPPQRRHSHAWPGVLASWRL